MRVLAAAAAVFATVLPSLALRAQAGQDLAAREQKLVAAAVAGLHAAADAYAAQKQHAQAQLLRREIWMEYDEHDEKARDKTGFARVGAQWRKDPQKLVIDKDLKVDPKLLKKIEQDLAALRKKLAADHRLLAQDAAKAGDATRAAKHWGRVLAMLPNDAEAAGALAMSSFEGFAGSPEDLAMLRRGRAIRGASDWLMRTPFPVTELSDKHPLLAAANVTHTGVKSRHYTIWGNLSPDDLKTLAMDAERSLLLCRTLFGTSRGMLFQPVLFRDMVFVRQTKEYHAVLDQCANQFDAQRLAFLKNDVDQAFLAAGKQFLRLHKADIGLDAARDQTVRGVVQDASGVNTNGLWEGLGHAACGFLFGRSLSFLIEQQKAVTVASVQQKTLVPDMNVWMQIAEESAWGNTGTRTSELVLLSAAKFTTEQRVKAWAICHYLLHWRPDLLHQLDQSQTPKIQDAPGVEAEFQKRTQQSLPKIDTDFTTFWSRSANLRKAMQAPAVPDDKAADHKAKVRARSLVDAINQARADAAVGPLGAYFVTGDDAKAVVAYDEALTKVEADRKKKPKEVFADPVAPAAIGRSVLYSRATDPKALVASWLTRPVLRDRLLHPGRDLLGSTPFAGAFVLDVALPVVPTRSGPPMAWPAAGQRIAGTVASADLGPRAVAAFAAAGKELPATVGAPLTLHFLRAVPAAVLMGTEVKVYAGNFACDGVKVVYAGGDDDGDQADGLLAFVPLQPLPSKAQVEVTWTLPPGVLGKNEKFPVVTFTVE
ncbi:MAG: hypothetical protein JNK15_00235 [Planctomycetes bacterium]|nr:hypothetical protein [Planctomycetota bacterium]